MPQVGISSTGIKIPLMNTRGNFMRVDSIITLAGTSVGGVERIAAKEEKQKAANITPNTRIAG